MGTRPENAKEQENDARQRWEHCTKARARARPTGNYQAKAKAGKPEESKEARKEAKDSKANVGHVGRSGTHQRNAKAKARAA